MNLNNESDGRGRDEAERMTNCSMFQFEPYVSYACMKISPAKHGPGSMIFVFGAFFAFCERKGGGEVVHSPHPMLKDHLNSEPS